MFGVDVVDCVAVIVFQCGADIPAVMSMGCPRAALISFVMGKDLDAWWCKGCCSEVKAAVGIFVC